jgi:hypothetical protein
MHVIEVGDWRSYRVEEKRNVDEAIKEVDTVPNTHYILLRDKMVII